MNHRIKYDKIDRLQLFPNNRPVQNETFLFVTKDNEVFAGYQDEFGRIFLFKERHIIEVRFESIRGFYIFPKMEPPKRKSDDIY